MKISVLGCGRWGAFLAWYLDRIGHNVISWGLPSSDKFIQLSSMRNNGILTLRDSVNITGDLSLAVRSSDVIVISISAQALRQFMYSLNEFDLSGKIIVLCMKGIEEETGLRLTQIVDEFVGEKTPLAVWVGPGHPQDFVNNIPNCMVIDSNSDSTKRLLVNEFSSELIRFYFGKDLIGSEVGAAAKNVVGIAAGMLDGLNYSSLKGALMSRGTREIARLIKAMGGNENSAYGLCHLGDYQATLFSPYSHNRRYGEALVKNEKYYELAEGVSTAGALMKLGEKYSVDLPIVNAVNDIVTFGKNPKVMLNELFGRTVKEEF